MIVRVFRPTVHPGKEREFEAFLRSQLRAAPRQGPTAPALTA